jgi:hypothetical protein
MPTWVRCPMRGALKGALEAGESQCCWHARLKETASVPPNCAFAKLRDKLEQRPHYAGS